MATVVFLPAKKGYWEFTLCMRTRVTVVDFDLTAHARVYKESVGSSWPRTHSHIFDVDIPVSILASYHAENENLGMGLWTKVAIVICSMPRLGPVTLRPNLQQG